MADVNMRILMSVVGGGVAAQAIGGLAKSLSGGDGLKGALLGVGVAAGALAIGLGMQAVQAAGDFQAGITSLSTGAGELQSNLGLVSNGILDLADSTGTSTQQLISGMYMIESAGYHGSQGLQVLQVAAEGAKVGNADLGTVANTVTTVLTDYHMSANQAAAAMNGLTTTVASGKTHLQDLASSMGTVLPLASSLGLSFPQVAGALATMTNSGMSAQRSSMELANAIRSLGAPSSTAEKSMAAVGLSAQQLKDTLSTQGLSGALKLIEDHVNSKFPAGSVQAVTAFKNIMGGATGYNVALMLGGKNMQSYQQNINNVSGAMNNGKGSVQGWSQVQGTFNQKLSQAKEFVETTGIKIGTVLLPVVSTLLGGLMNLATWLGNVANFFQQNQVAGDILKGVLIAAAGVILGLLIPAMVGWATSAWGAAAGMIAATWPILLIIVLVGLLIAGVMLLVQHWQQVEKFAQQIWGHITQFFRDDVVKPIGDLFNNLGTSVHNTINNIGNFFSGLGTSVHDTINSIIKWFHDLPGNATKEIQNLVSQGQKLFQNFWNNVVSDAKSILGNIGTAIGNGFKSAIDDIFINPINWIIGGINNITGKLGIPAIPKIPLLALGGTIATGGLAIVGERGPELVGLPSGATVYPNGTGPAGYGAGGPNIYISISTMARSQSEVSRFVDMIEQEIGRRMRTQTPGYNSAGIF